MWWVYEVVNEWSSASSFLWHVAVFRSAFHLHFDVQEWYVLYVGRMQASDEKVDLNSYLN